MGDFFQIGTKGGSPYEHVGVILDFVGEKWTAVEAGQGGPRSGYDSIKPTLLTRKNIVRFLAGKGRKRDAKEDCGGPAAGDGYESHAQGNEALGS
jgi:hypothetical protein